MSTTDDSASRRARRPDAEGQQWHAANRGRESGAWAQPSPRDRDAYGRGDERRAPPSDPRQASRPSYSNFSRHDYPPPRQELAPPPNGRGEGPALPQSYYPEPSRSSDGGRTHLDRGYSPYSQPVEADPGPLLHAPDRDDLFGAEPPGYEQSSYGGQAQAYDSRFQERPAPLQGPSAPPMRQAARLEEDTYRAREAPSPLDDYERSFPARFQAQEAPATRFYLPEESAPQWPAAAEQFHQRQPDPERLGAYPQPQPARGRDPYGQSDQAYDRGHAETWRDDAQLPAHGSDLDEDYFADEDEFDQEEHAPAPRKSRKKLIAAALAGAIAVGGGGAYLLKTYGGRAAGATPIIAADNTPAKALPAAPGGRQFANGEKSIYDRLTPQGPVPGSPPAQALVSAAQAAPVPSPAAAAPATAGPANSLDARIDAALKKARQSGDAPAADGTQAGSDRPTVVHGETYGPDGNRTDAGQQMAAADMSSASPATPPMPSGAFQPQVTATNEAGGPFLPQTVAAAPENAPAPHAARPAGAPRQKVATAQPEAAAPAAAAAGGYYVQLKSSQDEKAAARELQALTGKYQAALGDVPLTTRTVDLGAKGVWFRTMAGPVPSKEAAAELCTKLKDAGLGNCLIHQNE